MTVATHLCLFPRKRVSGVVTPLLHTFYWCGLLIKHSKFFTVAYAAFSAYFCFLNYKKFNLTKASVMQPVRVLKSVFNPLTPNDHYSGRTAPLTSKRCILYIYSTNIATEYFKHGIYSPFFSLQNAVCFIILTYLVPVLFTFYIQGVLKLKK